MLNARLRVIKSEAISLLILLFMVNLMVTKHDCKRILLFLHKFSIIKAMNNSNKWHLIVFALNISFCLSH